MNRRFKRREEKKIQRKRHISQAINVDNLIAYATAPTKIFSIRYRRCIDVNFSFFRRVCLLSIPNRNCNLTVFGALSISHRFRVHAATRDIQFNWTQTTNWFPIDIQSREKKSQWKSSKFRFSCNLNSIRNITWKCSRGNSIVHTSIQMELEQVERVHLKLNERKSIRINLQKNQLNCE